MSEVKSQTINPTQGGGDDSLPQEVMDKVIDQFITAPGRLLLILENLQKENQYNYLPISVLKYVAKKLLMPVSKVYGVATFYSFFNLKPQGKHCVTVCRGTAFPVYIGLSCQLSWYKGTP
jgi:NADH:ubiquinone oxidoreductase subunit E